MEKPSLFVAGRFDDNGGKPSKIAQIVFDAVKSPETAYYNGVLFKISSRLLKTLKNINSFFGLLMCQMTNQS